MERPQSAAEPDPVCVLVHVPLSRKPPRCAKIAKGRIPDPPLLVTPAAHHALTLGRYRAGSTAFTIAADTAPAAGSVLVRIAIVVPSSG